MIELPVKYSANVRRTLEENDFRYFAKQIAHKWAEYYATAKGGASADAVLMDWEDVEDVIAHGRFCISSAIVSPMSSLYG